jgi:hypothetical protein
VDLKLIYKQICERGQIRSLDSAIYTEKHHIIPRCMGGSSEKSNLTKLTAKEHFICHKLLHKIYPDNEKLRYAFWAMCNQVNKRGYIVSSRDHEYARDLCLKMWKRPKTLEWKKNIAKSKKGKKINTNQQGKLNHNFSKIWVTNTVTNESKMIKGEIPEGWKKGRVKVGSLGKSKIKGKSWYYKENQEKYFDQNEAPEGWVRGRLPKTPFREIKEGSNVIRTFSSETDPESLVWHRDLRDREVTVLQETDWQFQFDNELPQLLKDVIFIPKNIYHRVIKGTGELTLQILEF